MIYSLDGLMIGERSAPRDRRPLARKMFEECEHLARALAGGTVTLNIVPATGPITAGGDQGRDFETYRTELPGQVQSLGRDIGLRDTDCAGPCCTLQQENVEDGRRHRVDRRQRDGTGGRGARSPARTGLRTWHRRGHGRGQGPGRRYRPSNSRSGQVARCCEVEHALHVKAAGSGCPRASRSPCSTTARPALVSRWSSSTARPALRHRRGAAIPGAATPGVGWTRRRSPGHHAATARTGRHRPVHSGGSPSGPARS